MGRFARAVDADLAHEPAAETAECAAAWTAAGDALEGLVVLYAIESAQPAISRTKLEGLVEHYGLDEGPATEYFSLHAERDHEHAAQSRAADRGAPRRTPTRTASSRSRRPP